MANHLKPEMKQTIISMLCEGCTIRSVERITRVHRDTIMRLMVRCGEHCKSLMADKLRGGVYTSSLQLDELWTFVGKKQRRLLPGDPIEYGDAYGFLGIDRETKFIVAEEIGERDEETTDRFIETISERVIGEVQVFTDGWGPYRQSIPRHFGHRAHFMQVVKSYDSNATDEHRYSPPKVRSVDHVWVQGSPRAGLVSTSHVERHNWSVRGSMRRFTRLSNGFSHQLANLRAAFSLYTMWYNWCKKHRTIGTTPAIAMGLASEQWAIDRLVQG